MSKEIISLVETSTNIWKAKYHGNYGIYNIKIKLDGEKLISYSCSCPSDYDPCKHIDFIRTAIDKRIKEDVTKTKSKDPNLEDLIKNIPHADLREFVLKLAKHNPELQNTIFLEFLHKVKQKRDISYNEILRKALHKVSFDYEDIYDYEGDPLQIYILEEWFAKARDFMEKNQYDQAIAIFKACIEEYSDRILEMDSEIIENIDPIYYEEPFAHLIEIAKNPLVNAMELFEYSINEMIKSKYRGTPILHEFNNFISQIISTKEQAEIFLALQDKQLLEVGDNGTYETEIILRRKINFYQNNNNSEQARKILEQNIQIPSFRNQVVELLIQEKKYEHAKKLIMDVLKTDNPDDDFQHSEWSDHLLTIAQKQHDIPTIRRVTSILLKNYFQLKYYRIYKSTFKGESWNLELPTWINRYNPTKKYFSSSLADLYVEEKDTESLLAYIKKHVSTSVMENYYDVIVKQFPQETLQLFKIAIDNYLKTNTGRNHYEYVCTLFSKILRIEGGSEMLTPLILQYISQYKNRSALVQTFKSLKFKV